MMIFTVWITAIFTTEKKLKSESKVCEDKDFDWIVMTFEKNNTLKFNQ